MIEIGCRNYKGKTIRIYTEFKFNYTFYETDDGNIYETLRGAKMHINNIIKKEENKK